MPMIGGAPLRAERAGQDRQAQRHHRGRPVPCTVRAASSQPTLGATALHAEASVKVARPAANTRRRTNRSPSAAAVMIPAA
jgi:hypothetical protein